MASEYNEILNRSWDEIPEPKLLPRGSWLLKGRNMVYIEAKDEGKSPQVLCFYVPREAMNDVDSAALAELGDDYDLTGNQIVKRFFIENARSWADVRNHLAKHGIDVAGKTQAQTFEAFKGTEVIAFLDQDTYVNKATGEARVDNVPSEFVKVE